MPAPARVEDMVEGSHWHPVAPAGELTQDRPLAVRLLERELVLWRDAEGAVHAWADRCPHRGAQLSMGRLVAGRLECPYHGWRFDSEGQCRHIPALPDFTPPASHRACTHEVRAAYGLLWARLAAGTSDIPAFAAETDTRLRKVNCGPYDVHASAPRIVENFLDMAHFGYVHEGWLGSRDSAQIDAYAVEATPTGFLATGCKAWQPQSSVHAQGGTQVEYTYEVNAPYTAILTKVPEPGTVRIEGFRESIALFICPVEPERSRVWFRLAMNDFASPDSKLQAFQHTIFTQDQPVLESQRPKRLPIGAQAPVGEVHCAADRSSIAYRRHLRELGITFGVC